MMDAPDSPRWLVRQWTALLLAPVAWTAALGILFALTEDACARGDRRSMWIVATVCVLLALSGVTLAWSTREEPGADSGADRARFLMRVALGMSAIFAVVLIVTAVPILMLGACRT
jgi:hypothetical protein